MFFMFSFCNLISISKLTKISQCPVKVFHFIVSFRTYHWRWRLVVLESVKVCTILIRLKWVKVVKLLLVILFINLGIAKFYYDIIGLGIQTICIWNDYFLTCSRIIKHSQCEVCEFAKLHYSSFPKVPYRPSKSFTLLHPTS